MQSHRNKEEINIPHKTKRRKIIEIGQILGRSCLIKRVIEGKMDGREKMKKA
jgi:hypothetical protein